MIKKFAAFAAICLLLSVFAQAADSTAINIAGQQGMLSQRIVKSYCQISLNILPEHSQNELNQAIMTFEDNLKQLEMVATSPGTKFSLIELRQVWTPLRRGAQGTVTAAIANILDQQAETVLRAADQLTAELQDQSTSPVSRWVNTSGRQRMLSQRLVKAYMLRQMGLDTSSKRQELESTIHEFSGALRSLKLRKENTEKLQSEINMLATQWDWLLAALTSDGANDYRLIVAESSNVVLEIADRITALFAESEADSIAQ